MALLKQTSKKGLYRLTRKTSNSPPPHPHPSSPTHMSLIRPEVALSQELSGASQIHVMWKNEKGLSGVLIGAESGRSRMFIRNMWGRRSSRVCATLFRFLLEESEARPLNRSLPLILPNWLVYFNVQSKTKSRCELLSFTRSHLC